MAPHVPSAFKLRLTCKRIRRNPSEDSSVVMADIF